MGPNKNRLNSIGNESVGDDVSAKIQMQIKIQ